MGYDGLGVSSFAFHVEMLAAVVVPAIGQAQRVQPIVISRRIRDEVRYH